MGQYFFIFLQNRKHAKNDFIMINAKYIFVTGGVTSSLGKGIISSSLALLLKKRGFKVTNQKLDPYINVDPGTLNPYEHGECFVTEDGAETDLDLGHYERFTNVRTSQANNVTTGRIYSSVIEKERKGEYLGSTVQVIPHITDEIKNKIKILGNTGEYDFIITEIGGVVGDIESLPFMEAVRQLKREFGRNAIVIHLTLVPYLAAAGELKTKPTQNSVKNMLSIGIQPDIIVCRCEKHLTQSVKDKISLFCNVDNQSVIESIDASTIYEVPLNMVKEGLDTQVLKLMNVTNCPEPDLSNWKKFLYRLDNPINEITIGLVGKYVELHDAYKSITESFIHASAVTQTKVNIRWIHSESLENGEDAIKEKLDGLDGILVGPGFGSRGILGKINACKYARENNIPFLGICLGMQCAVIEFARNVLGFKGANSIEIQPATPYPVIDMMEEQKKISNLGHTMRLGNYDCHLSKGSKIYEAYGKESIKERHRHRYEFNSKYRNDFAEAGMIATGVNPNTSLVEVIEIPSLSFYVGVQFHPEYASTVEQPSPIFVAFVKAAAHLPLNENNNTENTL